MFAFSLTCLAMFSQSDRAEAVKAAKEKYAAMIVAAEREYLEAELRNAKAGRTSRQVVEAAQNNLDLWKAGLYSPRDSAKILPPLKNPESIKVGDIGTLLPFELVSILDENTTLIRTRKSAEFDPARNTVPFVLSRRTDDLEGLGNEITIYGTPFWVSGKRTVGKQSLFVIEPLLSEK